MIERVFREKRQVPFSTSVRLLSAAAALALCAAAPAAWAQTPPDAPAFEAPAPGGLGAGDPLVSGDAGGPLEVLVTGGEFEPTPIGVPRFIALDPQLRDLADQIGEVVVNDLVRSELFEIVQGPATVGLDEAPAISEWTAAGAEALLLAEVGLEPDGRLGVRFRLWTVSGPEGEQLEHLKFLADPTGWRRVAHKVADVVYSQITGEPPYFDTRIVFVEETGPKSDRRKRLAIMDSDGANIAYLTGFDDLVLTPRFSPVEQAITFVSDADDGLLEVFLLNLTTERQEELGDFPGLTFAPRFSPDGGRVALSLQRGAATDIFLMNLATRRVRQLTDTLSIDTAPSFAPNGAAIVFESDRGGSQQLYVMRSDGSSPTRISFGDGRYATPVWSPRCDLIAFTRISGGRFQIGVMRWDGSGERLLTDSFHDSGPTWAPNGRTIMFYREPPGETSRPQLFTVDIFTGRVRAVPTPDGASDPAWSPLLDGGAEPAQCPDFDPLFTGG